MLFSVAKKQVEFFSEGVEGTLMQTLTNQSESCCKVHGVYWAAKLYQVGQPMCLLPGAPLKILGRENLCLLVQPL